jgi:CRISPR/Cas system endoribonuclease Cas6 (RAMP superfamily)
LLILSSSGKALTIWTEADAVDIEIAILVNILVLENGHVLTSDHVKNMSRVVAACGKIFAITAETDTTDNAVMDEVMNRLNVKNPLRLGVKHGIPISALSFLRSKEIFSVPISQYVASSLTLLFVLFRHRHGPEVLSRRLKFRRRRRRFCVHGFLCLLASFPTLLFLSPFDIVMA